MSEATPETEPVVAKVRSSALRIVLFGMPDAGKTSLLGALAQASQTQSQTLHGQMHDLTGRLEQLRHQVYEETLHRTPEEIVAYPVRFEPHPSKDPQSAASKQPLEAVLYDCDGRIAHEYLSEQRSLFDDLADPSLGSAILNADTLILVLDASSRAEVVDRDFDQFVRFLRLLQHSRSHRNEVNGLPVFLVLSKCDLLAQGSDTSTAWIDRIEERKRTIDRKFRNYLKEESARTQLPFGRIELHLWATAIKRPPLQSAPEKPKEPYGVAELFRQSLDAAIAFRKQRQFAQRRLQLILAGVSGVVGVMVLLAIFIWLTRPGPEVARLAKSIQSFESTYEAGFSDRFERLDEYITTLNDFKESPNFGKVPADLQQFVNKNLKELHAYQEFDRELMETIKKLGQPQLIRNEDNLERLAKRLEELAPPAEYANQWTGAEAVREYRNYVQEIRAIKNALKTVKEGYQKANEAGKEADDELRRNNNFNAAVQKAKEVTDWVKDLPNKKDDGNRLIPDSKTITWSVIFDYPSVRQVYQLWENDIEKKVKTLNELAKMN